MRATLFLWLLLSASLALKAEEIPLDDIRIIPGVRVGPIEKGMTLFGLKTLLGSSKIKHADIHIGEGETMAGTRLFEGTDKELEIIFNPEGDEKEIWDIRILGKKWHFENGLKLGLSVEAVEKINGQPFNVQGFGWDYGGYANFDGGKLADLVSIRFGTTSPNVPDELSGDRLIPSTSKKLRAAKPVVEQITVSFH